MTTFGLFHTFNMCFPYKILSLSLLLITTALCSDVLELDDGNFDSNIREHSFGLLQFYSPRCGYCTRLAPKYEEAASILKNNNPPIVLVKGKILIVVFFVFQEYSFSKLCLFCA